MLRFLFCLVFFAFCATLFAQEEQDNPPKFKAVLVNFGYGFQLPYGDLADRFGPSSTVGFSPEFNLDGYIFGVEGEFLFGAIVDVDPLINIRNAEGAILGDNREFANTRLTERGFYLGGHVAKIIKVVKKHPNSGIRLGVGMGIFQHKIKIDDESGNAIQIAGDLKKGYDKLTNGLAVKQFLGFHHFSRNRLVNFAAGFEFMQGFTRSRRDFDFDTMMQDTQNRFDGYMGLKVIWTLPIFVGDSDQYSYY